MRVLAFSAASLLVVLVGFSVVQAEEPADKRATVKDQIELLTGAKVSGEIVDRNAKTVTINATVSGATLKRVYPLASIHRVVFQGREIVLNQKEAKTVRPAQVRPAQVRPAAAQAVAAAPQTEVAETKSAASASHEELPAIEVKGGAGRSLQTLTITPDGVVVGLVAPARTAPIGVAGSTCADSELRLFDGDGKEGKRWTLTFHGHSVAGGPDGAIYAAGEGRIAKFDASGKLLAEAEVPHLTALLKDQDALRQQADEQRQTQTASIESTMKNFQQQLERLEAKGDELTAAEKQQVTAYQSNIKSYQTMVERYKTQTTDDVIKQLTSRLRIINGIAVTEKDVYLACGESKGYGYAIYRMDPEFKTSERVLGPVSGCCGQMDVQARGDSFYLSENTKKRVAQYDRTGKFVAAFGQSGRESDGLSFGGCCNPMNCRVTAGGDIYTAESEGIVKRFSAAGEFLGLVGYAKLTGGCKNVSVAASPNGDKVYFCDLPGSRIIVLGEKKDAATAGAE